MEIKTLHIDVLTNETEEIVLSGADADVFVEDRNTSAAIYEATKMKHEEAAQNKLAAIEKLLALGLTEAEARAISGQ
jgi:DNA-binding transcriptional regulator YhcF (GntR family)